MGRIERTFRTIGLRHKGVAIVVLMFLAMSFLYAWTAYSALGKVGVEIAERNRASAESVAERFDRLLARALEKLRSTASLPGLAHAVEQISESEGTVVPAGQTLHYLFMQSALMTGGVVLTDRAGTVLWTEPLETEGIGAVVPGGSVAQDVLRRGRTSIGRASGFPGHENELVVAVPLNDLAGNLSGGLFGFIDPLNPMSGVGIEPTALGRTASVELIAGDEILTLAEASGRHRAGSWRRAQRDLGSVSGRAALRRLDAIEGESGPRLGAYVPLREARWGILLTLDEDEILAPARSLRWTVIVVGAACALLLALLAVPILNRFVGPVEQIAAAAQALARGAFDHPLPARAHGEVGALAGAFERMRNDLQDLVSRLTDSEARYRRSIDQAADPIISLDVASGVVIDANRRALELMGIGEDRIGRITYRELHPAEDHATLHDHLAEARAGVEAVEIETKVSGRDGQPVPVAIRSTLIETRRERFVQQIWRDLTERKTLERRMLQTEKMTSLGVVAAGVAHEVRNPLSAVISCVQDVDAELFKNASDPDLELVKETLRDALEAARQIGTIVHDIHRYAHPGTERRDPGDIRDVLDQSIRLAASALKRRAEVIRDYGEVPPVAIDGGRLTQVFLNLLVNCAHALESVDRKGEIRVRIWSEPGWVRCEVADNGCGIPEHLLAKIFDPFVTTKEPGKGTGLGLALALRIVHEHGGTIDVSSEVGRGTRFVLSFPAWVDPEEENEDAEHAAGG